MAKRKNPIHQTAMPLYAYMQGAKVRGTTVAERIGVKSQHVFNWLVRGIPAEQISNVAALCGISTDEYRKQAGIASTVERGVPLSDLTESTIAVEQIAALPPFLRHYIASKIRHMVRHYNAVPPYMRGRLDPPRDDAEQYAMWERDIEHLLLTLADFNGVNGEKKRVPAPLV